MNRLKTLIKRDLTYISAQKLQELINRGYTIEDTINEGGCVSYNNPNQLSNQIRTLAAATTKLVGQTMTLSSRPSGGSPNYTVTFLKGVNQINQQTGITPAMAAAGVTYTYPSTGGLTTADTATYTITVTDTCVGNTASDSSAVTVYSLLSVPTISATGVTGTCPNISASVGNSVQLSIAPSGGSGTYTYQWYLGANPISGATSSTYSFSTVTTSAGSYTVHVSDATSGQNNISSSACTLAVSCIPLGVGFGIA